VAGFCIETSMRQPGYEARRTLRLVDLGQCESVGSFQAASLNVAWLHAANSRDWWVRSSPNELLVVEGNPDRLPRETELLPEWLAGRWGSFRGFQVLLGDGGTPQITAFVDPLCTRPIFYRAISGQLLISDKPATIALNAHEDCTLNWDAVLEAMLLGSVYMYNLTSLDGTSEIAPGESVVFRDNNVVARYCNRLPEDESIVAADVARDPKGTLKLALERSVRECWSDRESALLLSGGLDSRAILALAGEGRKSVTLEQSARETQIAREIAAACHAEFLTLPFPADEWLRRAQEGFWIAAAMRDTEFVNDIGLAGRLAPLNISAIAHGYLFDTILKGWLIRPVHKHIDLSRTVYSLMGPAGVHFRDTTSRASFHADKDVFGVLSKDGAQQATMHLRRVAESLAPATEDKLDLTFERHVLGWLSKQVHYGCFLSWLEALDVRSPAFHPALWSWYRHSRAEDRYLGRAYRRMLLSLNHPAFAVPDANTGLPIAPAPQPKWTEKAQDQLWYRATRRVWRTVRGRRQPPYADTRAAAFRSPQGRALMEFGIETLRGNPLFNDVAVQRALQDFLAGQDRPFEPLLTLTGAAQWYDRVSRAKNYSAPQIREVVVGRAREIAGS